MTFHPRSQGFRLPAFPSLSIPLSSLAPGVGKTRDPGNEVGDFCAAALTLNNRLRYFPSTLSDHPLGRLIEVKTIEKPSSGLDHWPPNRGDRLIGDRLKGFRLYLYTEGNRARTLRQLFTKAKR